MELQTSTGAGNKGATTSIVLTRSRIRQGEFLPVINGRIDVIVGEGRMALMLDIGDLGVTATGGWVSWSDNRE